MHFYTIDAIHEMAGMVVLEGNAGSRIHAFASTLASAIAVISPFWMDIKNERPSAIASRA